MTAPTLHDGPANAPLTFLLAHGAGAPMDSPFLQVVAEGLSCRGWDVVRFEFPYMARSRLSGKKLLQIGCRCWRPVFESRSLCWQSVQNLIIGGKSMGGRVATQLLDALASSTNVCAGVCMGYPLPPSWETRAAQNSSPARFEKPLLVLQGERDTFGKHEEVMGYGLPEQVSVPLDSRRRPQLQAPASVQAWISTRTWLSRLRSWINSQSSWSPESA